jgi:hypothetical protein
MSHFTDIETRIRDIPALRRACAELGFELLDDAEARGYSRNRVRGRHVVRLKGPYDIAVNPGPDGGFALTADWWGGHVEREVGKGCGRLLQAYGVAKTRAEAVRRGYRVTQRTLADGAVKLTIGGLRG